MKRQDYKNYVWYELTDNEYWVDDSDEFENCVTIVYHPEYCNNIMNKSQAYLGWGTMAKYGDWKFMIIEKPDK